MKLKRKLLLAIATVAFSLTAQAEDVPKKVYMFGVGASFSDSTVYITDVQEVSAFVSNDSKKFLAGRDQYTYQLKNLLTSTNRMKNPTCATFYALKKDKLEKKREKVLKQFTQQKKKKKKKDKSTTAESAETGFYNIVNLGTDAFKYETVASDTKKETKEEAKARKQKEKELRKQQQQQAQGGRPGNPPAGGKPNGAPPSGAPGGMGGGR